MYLGVKRGGSSTKQRLTVTEIQLSRHLGEEFHSLGCCSLERLSDCGRVNTYERGGVLK